MSKKNNQNLILKNRILYKVFAIKRLLALIQIHFLDASRASSSFLKNSNEFYSGRSFVRKSILTARKSFRVYIDTRKRKLEM